MLKIQIPGIETYDELTNLFTYEEGLDFEFEYSLKAIAVWEQKYHKPFLSREPHSEKEMLDFYKMMCLKGDPNKIRFDNDVLKQIHDYIEDKHTATTIKKTENGGGGTYISAELIYAMMIEARIPFDAELWHLNNLLMTISVLSSRANPKKMSIRETQERNMAINKARQEAMKAKGVL